MSAISQSIRFKLGDFCRHLFHKPARSSAPAPAAATVVPAQSPRAEASAGSVTISLRSVLVALPVELRSRIRPVDTQSLGLTVPFETIFPDITRGAVRMSFGEIRRSAPQVFTPGIQHDDAPVVLPLNEILSRLDPSFLARRATQKKAAALPEEISSPFAGRGAGLTIATGSGKPAAPTRAPAAMPEPAKPEPAKPEPTKETSFTRKPGWPVSAPAAVAPSAIKFPDSDEQPLFVRKPAAPTPQVTSTSPATPPPPSPPPKPKDYLAARPVPRAMQPAKAETPAVAPAPTSAAKLFAPLATIAATWSDALRQELMQLNRGDAQLAMPVDLIEASLKRGRVSFAWKTLRTWIYPAVPPGMSAYDAAEVELPLSVVAPLFLARQKEFGHSQRITVDAAIPDLFFGSPKPEPAPVPKPVAPDTRTHIWSENSDTIQMEAEPQPRPKPAGVEPVGRHASPNDIVARASKLDGVAGALIALPEGLLVAGRVPAEFSGDNLAAFLPQIFSKVSQATKELRLGELNNLNFTVGSVPWKVVRVNTLFFAAFGHADGTLPNNELARLATELDRRH